MKTKLIVGAGFMAIKYDEKSFFSSILGFKPHWDIKNYNEYISQKVVILSSTNKIRLKCDIIDGKVVNGTREPIPYTFVLDNPNGYKVFFQPETIQ